MVSVLNFCYSIFVRLVSDTVIIKWIGMNGTPEMTDGGPATSHLLRVSGHEVGVLRELVGEVIGSGPAHPWPPPRPAGQAFDDERRIPLSPAAAAFKVDSST